MAEMSCGYLLKSLPTLKDEKIEVYKLVDFIVGIYFTNTDNIHMFNIASGKYKNKYAYDISESNDEKLYFIPSDTNVVIKKNKNSVDFFEIRKKELKNNAKYHYKDNDGNIHAITDKEIIAKLDKIDGNRTEFDEGVFENKTDISTMYNSIKKTVISQDEQIMQILTALYKNQKVANSNLDIDLIAKLKENVLIYGPTGTGKTEILKRISRLYNIPIVIYDVTTLSEVGYVGGDVVDMLKELYAAADEDIELAEKGILVIDEFDKLAEKSGDNQSHVSREGVQRSLLKMLDGAVFYLEDTKFDTSKLSIVCLGAFTGIAKDEDYKKITYDDFRKYGIKRELLGRFSKTIAMNDLKKEDIIKILKESDFSPLNTYRELFKEMKINFKYTDDFIDYIAELAMEKESGARSLKTVFDEAISSALFKIFAGEYTGIELIRPNDENTNPYILSKDDNTQNKWFKKKKKKK